MTMKSSQLKLPGKYIIMISVMFFSLIILKVDVVEAQENIDVGKTGWDVKRPVFAAACETGCPWGELGDFVK